MGKSFDKNVKMIYSGEWDNDVYNRKGILIIPKAIKKVNWINGKFSGTGTYDYLDDDGNVEYSWAGIWRIV